MDRCILLRLLPAKPLRRDVRGHLVYLKGVALASSKAGATLQETV